MKWHYNFSLFPNIIPEGLAVPKMQNALVLLGHLYGIPQHAANILTVLYAFYHLLYHNRCFHLYFGFIITYSLKFSIIFSWFLNLYVQKSFRHKHLLFPYRFFLYQLLQNHLFSLSNYVILYLRIINCCNIRIHHYRKDLIL